MDIKMIFARWFAGMAASASKINLADVSTIDAMNGVTPLPIRAARAAERFGGRLDNSRDTKRAAKARLAKARREEIASQLGLDAVNRVQNKAGRG